MRNNKPRPSFFFCEEFQVFFTPTMRQTMQTSSNVRAVRTTQTSSPTQNFPAMLKGGAEGHSVHNLLGNRAPKIFLRNTDPQTNTWGSALFGEQIETLVETSRSAGTVDPRRSGASTSVSGSASSGRKTGRVHPPGATLGEGRDRLCRGDCSSRCAHRRDSSGAALARQHTNSPASQDERENEEQQEQSEERLRQREQRQQPEHTDKEREREGQDRQRGGSRPRER
jgi:hypothetical protein